jgi:phage-related protein
MPDIGTGCHELRVVDDKVTWRIMYHIGADAVVILDVFTRSGPKPHQRRSSKIVGCVSKNFTA